MQNVNRVLLPLDGSDFARSSVEMAKTTAQQHGAKITVLGCLALNKLTGQGIDLSPLAVENYWNETRAGLVKHLNEVVQELKEAGVEAEQMVVSGRPTDQILRTAGKVDADLIVMSTHGRRGIKRWMKGSVTEGVMRRSSCPVLTIPVSAQGSK